MKNIIENFYYGELIPCEKPSPNSKKYKETSAQLANIEEEMLNKYPDITTQLEQHRDLMYKLTAIESANDFCYGFRLGALFMCDIFNNDRKE